MEKRRTSQVIPIVNSIVLLVLCIISMLTRQESLVWSVTHSILEALSLGLFVMMLNLRFRKILCKTNIYLMYWMFIYISFVPSLFIIQLNTYALTFLLGSALVTYMVHSKLGLITHFFLLLFLALTVPISIEVLLFYMMAGIFINLTIHYAKQRGKVIYVSVSAMVLMAFLAGLINYSDKITWSTLPYASILIAALNGILVVIVTVGSEAIWEAIFSITSLARLKELSNSTEPLLQKLLVEAPGTYHHSMIVANLAEKAAASIGCNASLARAGGLYHDIGKMKRPNYFMENQEGENIHDQLSPESSAEYIIAHVRDGVFIAKEYKLPEEIIEIIQEHHGDSVVAYFYQKAKEELPEISQEKFTYNGPKPKSKEAAIVMLADCVEAASKGVKEKTTESMQHLILEVIHTVMNLGQLSDSPLRFNEMPQIASAFFQVYNGMFHERIQYKRELSE